MGPKADAIAFAGSCACAPLTPPGMIFPGLMDSNVRSRRFLPEHGGSVLVPDLHTVPQVPAAGPRIRVTGMYNRSSPPYSQYIHRKSTIGHHPRTVSTHTGRERVPSVVAACTLEDDTHSPPIFEAFVP